MDRAVKSVKDDRPRTVYFYATSVCNSNCVYCIFRKDNHDMVRQHMPLEIIQRIWSDPLLYNTGVVLQGGEFTMHPQALSICEFMKTKSRKVTLLTNLVEPLDTIKLLRYVDQVTISYDGPNHDRSRGVPGNRAAIHSFLKDAWAINVPVNIQITLGPWNTSIADVKDAIELSEEHDIPLRFNVAYSDGLLEHGSYKQDRDKIFEIYKYMSERDEASLSTKYLGLVWLYMGHSRQRPVCYSTSMYTTIDQAGRVWFCQGLNEKEAIIGNLYRQTFSEIWAETAEMRKRYRACNRCALSCQMMGDIKFLQGSMK